MIINQKFNKLFISLHFRMIITISGIVLIMFLTSKSRTNIDSLQKIDRHNATFIFPSFLNFSEDGKIFVYTDYFWIGYRSLELVKNRQIKVFFNSLRFSIFCLFSFGYVVLQFLRFQRYFFQSNLFYTPVGVEHLIALLTL